MSRSIRKETSSLAFGIVGRFGGSSAGFVVAALNAASAASREVVVLRVLSADIHVLARNVAHYIPYTTGRVLRDERFKWPAVSRPATYRKLVASPSDDE